jgi:hypothetical protein
MKTIKKQIRITALALALVILIHGCSIYKSTPVSLEQAAKEEMDAKVYIKSGENFIFKRIVLEDGKYFGVKKEKGAVIKIPLNEQFIEKVKLEDKSWSSIATIGLSIVSLLGLLMVVALISGRVY